jgi:hypothetical protein
MSEWKKRDQRTATRRWSEYPVGSQARQSWTGFTWTRTERGWQASGGDTFPIPGDADEVCEADDATELQDDESDGLDREWI